MTGRRDPAVSASGKPNRDAPISAVRLSDDRRLAFIVSTTETRTSARARVCSRLTGAHLGRLDVDLAVAFGYGGSVKVGEVIGEVNVEAARSWACSFTSRCSGEVGDGVGYR
jgi:hypothetical protein